MNRGKSHGSICGKIFAFAVVCAVLIASTLLAAPRLHEQIHHASGAVNHICFVTLMSTGKCDCAAVTPVTVPNLLPHGVAFIQRRLELFAATLEFSRLEHAPPVFF